MLNFKNRIEVGVDYSTLYTSKGEAVLISNEDIPLITQYTWSIGKRGYVVARCKDKIISLHRLLFNFPKNMEIDHINLNRLDNRRDNLRVCDKLTNLRNKGTYKNNKSNFRGVSFLARLNKWRARIYIDGKEKHLGMFETKEQAIEERLKAEKEYYNK